MGAKSAGAPRPAMTSVRLPACAKWHGGDLAPYNLDVGREMAATGCKLRPKVNGGPHDWRVLSPMADGMADLFPYIPDLQLGPGGPCGTTVEGEHICGGSKQGRQMGGWKWTGATPQEHAEPHGPFTGIDDFIAPRYSTGGLRGMQLRLPAHQNQPGFGVVILNCLQELKIRPIWTALSGLKWQAGHALQALFLSSTAALPASFWIF
jgi:hypothetical protein